DDPGHDAAGYGCDVRVHVRCRRVDLFEFFALPVLLTVQSADLWNSLRYRESCVSGWLCHSSGLFQLQPADRFSILQLEAVSFVKLVELTIFWCQTWSILELYCGLFVLWLL